MQVLHFYIYAVLILGETTFGDQNSISNIKSKMPDVFQIIKDDFKKCNLYLTKLLL